MANSGALVPAIVFDVGGVLLAHDNDLMFRTLAARCSAPNALEYLLGRNFGLADGKRHVSSVHAELRRELGYSGDWKTFKAEVCCHFTLDQSMVRFAQTLAKSNRVLLFSNTFDVHWDYVTALGDGALARFESYASHLIGDAKPNVSAFLLVAERAGIDPRRSVFVDDVASFVDGAREAGFNAHQFIDRAGLERFLRSAGIDWRD